MGWFDFLEPVKDIWDIWTGEQERVAENEDRHYQKRLQKQIWAREDSAHQREVADLEKAGLSKYLSVGAGAQSGAVVPIGDPPKGTDYGLQHAQRTALREASKLSRLEQAKKAQEVQLSAMDVTKSAVERDILAEQLRRFRHDNQIYEDAGVPSNESPYMRAGGRFIDLVDENNPFKVAADDKGKELYNIAGKFTEPVEWGTDNARFNVEVRAIEGLYKRGRITKDEFLAQIKSLWKDYKDRGIKVNMKRAVDRVRVR